MRDLARVNGLTRNGSEQYDEVSMNFQSTYFAENIPELHRAYRSARGSEKPIALLVADWDGWYDGRTEPGVL